MGDQELRRGDDPWLLGLTLEVSVPLLLAELQSMDDRRRTIALGNWQRAGVEAVAGHGDILQYGYGPQKRNRNTRAEIAVAHRDLARAIAVLSLNRFGVEFLSRVWCARHSSNGAPGSYPCKACVAAEEAA